MLDPKLERILNQLLESARLKRYEFISLEHVLLTLTSKDEETQEILEACAQTSRRCKPSLKNLSNRTAHSLAKNF